MNEQETKQTDQRANWNIKPYLAVGLISFLVIIGSIAFFFLIFRYQEFTKILEKVMIILQPITIGLILAYLLNPVVNFEERHLLPFFQAKMNSQEKAKKVVRAISVAGALLFVVLVIGILLQMVIPELYKSINGMIGTLPKQVNGFMEWISDYVDNDSEISGYLEIGLTTTLIPDLTPLILIIPPPRTVTSPSMVSTVFSVSITPSSITSSPPNNVFGVSQTVSTRITSLSESVVVISLSMPPYVLSDSSSAFFLSFFPPAVCPFPASPESSLYSTST